MKTCKKCGETKSFQNFYKAASCIDGFRGECKTCVLASQAARYKASPDAKKDNAKRWRRNNPEKAKNRDKEYYRNNKEVISVTNKLYVEKNAEKIKAYQKEWRTLNEEKVRCYFRKYNRQQRATNPQFALASRLRTRLNQAIRSRQKTGSAIRDLGCSIPELLEMLDQDCLRKYGERYSTAPKGKYHIDHRRPLASFDLGDPEQLRLAVHHSNLQILLAAENIRKKDRA